MEVHYSSKKQDWGTPEQLYWELNKEFSFSIDVCAHKGNAKHPRFWSESDDGLAQDWSDEHCFMNPPYGREIAKWVKKASESGAAVVVGLLPARTDTRWFHDYIYNKPGVRIRFIKGRITFEGAKQGAPFPSMIVIWKGGGSPMT